jgi:hypothetical protein
MIIRIKSDYFSAQHQPTGPCRGGVIFYFLWSKNWTCTLHIPPQTSEFHHTAGTTTNVRGSGCVDVLHSHDVIARSTLGSVRSSLAITIPMDKQWGHLEVWFDASLLALLRSAGSHVKPQPKAEFTTCWQIGPIAHIWGGDGHEFIWRIWWLVREIRNRVLWGSQCQC